VYCVHPFNYKMFPQGIYLHNCIINIRRESTLTQISTKSATKLKQFERKDILILEKPWNLENELKMREQKHSSATPCPLAAEQSKTLSLPNRPSLSNHGSCCRGGRSSVGRRIDASHPPGPYERPPRRRPPPFRDALVRRHLLFPCLPPASLPLPPRSSTPAAARTPRSRAIAKSRAKILTESELRDPWLASLSFLPAEDSASADAAPTGWGVGDWGGS
jgi:hypothetical protein